MKQEQVIDILHQLGFTVEDITETGFGFRFEYEGLCLLYTPEEESETLTFITPHIFEFTEENRMMVLEKMSELASTIKFVQPTIMGTSSIWITYSHYLGKSEPQLEIVEHIIRALAVAACKFHELIQQDGTEEDESNE